jgi:serine/threonine-protein kinase
MQTNRGFGRAEWRTKPIERRERCTSAEPELVGDLTLKPEHHHLISKREQLATARRLRTAFAIALVLWTAPLVVDVIVANGNPTLMQWLVGMRALGSLVIAAGWLALRYVRDPSPGIVKFIDVSVMSSTCLFLCAMCLASGGLESRYSSALLLVMMVRVSTIAEPWSRGFPVYLGLGLAFPLFMLGISHFDPYIAAQFVERGPLTTFGMQCALILTGAGVGTSCGHAVWRARREVYESQSLGRYRLKARIGRGSMGEIWLARHVGLRQDVALKILSCVADNGHAAIARFEREVRVIAQLSHPNTVRILDYGMAPEGIWFYAMELLDGCDLAELLRRGGAFEAPFAVGLMKQACDALAEAHRSGVVHRDIKPSNLFVATIAGQADFLKVLDFGIAKLPYDQDSTLLTLDGSMLGTPCYMAPEAAGGGAVDPRSDVYALGCVLYELLAGRPPFEDATIAGLLRKHNETLPVVPSRKLGSPLPAEVERIVMRCLEKRPEDRFRDAGHMGRALASCV